MAVVKVDFPGNVAMVATIGDLRALPSPNVLDNAFYSVRGKGFYTFDAGSQAADNGDTVLKPDDLTPLQTGRWLFGSQGPAGPSNNTRLTLAELKAASITDRTSLYDGSLWTWTPGDFTGQADDLNVVQADGVALTVGAWERQSASGITFTPPGGTPRSTQGKLVEAGASITDYAASPTASPAINATAVTKAFTALAGPGNRGRIDVPKGSFPIPTDTVALPQATGLRISGQSQVSSLLTTDGSSGYALQLGTEYEYVVIENLALLNKAASRGTSVGIRLDPEGAGSKVVYTNLSIANYGTGVAVFDPTAPYENGDTNIFTRCDFSCDIAFDTGASSQAVINILQSCSFLCGTILAVNGAAETSIVKANVILVNDVVQFGPNAGGPACHVRMFDSKLEYHDPSGQRRIVFCSPTTSGEPVRVTFADSVLAGGLAVPADMDAHTIVENAGAALAMDIHRSRLSGAIAYRTTTPCSTLLWNITENERAPNPETLYLRRAPALDPGGASFPLIRWSHNENVIDQYRGGNLGTRWGDATKFIAFRHVGDALLNTGVTAGRQEFAPGKVGFDLTLAGLPEHTSQLRLAVWLDGSSAPNFGGGGSPAAIEVTQYSGPDFATTVGALKAIPAGARGLKTVHLEDWELGDGNLYVRVTTTGAGQIIRGAIVAFYFPWVEHNVQP